MFNFKIFCLPIPTLFLIFLLDRTILQVTTASSSGSFSSDDFKGKSRETVYLTVPAATENNVAMERGNSLRKTPIVQKGASLRRNNIDQNGSTAANVGIQKKGGSTLRRASGPAGTSNNSTANVGGTTLRRQNHGQISSNTPAAETTAETQWLAIPAGQKTCEEVGKSLRKGKTQYLAIPSNSNKANQETHFLAIPTHKNANTENTKFMALPTLNTIGDVLNKGTLYLTNAIKDATNQLSNVALATQREILDPRLSHEWPHVLHYFDILIRYFNGGGTLNANSNNFLPFLSEQYIDRRLISLIQRISTNFIARERSTARRTILLNWSIAAMVVMLHGNVLEEAMQKIEETGMEHGLRQINQIMADAVSSVQLGPNECDSMEQQQTWIMSEMSQTFNLNLVEWTNPVFDLAETMRKNAARNAAEKSKMTQYMAINSAKQQQKETQYLALSPAGRRQKPFETSQSLRRNVEANLKPGDAHRKAGRTLRAHEND